MSYREIASNSIAGVNDPSISGGLDTHDCTSGATNTVRVHVSLSCTVCTSVLPL